jgi:hypothetical protein
MSHGKAPRHDYGYEKHPFLLRKQGVKQKIWMLLFSRLDKCITYLK